MPPPQEVQAGSDRAEPLPELHPECASVLVGDQTSVENDKLPPRQLIGLSPAQAEQVRVAYNIFFVLSVVSVGTMIGRSGVSIRWSNLLETSGFSEWPMLGGLYLPIIASMIPVMGLAVFHCVRTCCARASRPWLVQALSKVCLVTAIASLLGCVCLVISWWVYDRISDDMVRGLARQAIASANFNRGYCQAWCRQTAKGLAAFVRGECGPDTPTVFTEIVGWLNVGDWCKEAIVKQNFDVGAVYNGVSPLACLNGRGGGALTATPWSDFVAFINCLAGVFLITASQNLAKIRHDSAKSS